MFLTILASIFLGLWLMSILGRILLRRWVAKQQQEFQQGGGDRASRGWYGFGGGRTDRKQRAEGEVTITKKTTARRETQVGKNVGEYVEFEEVEREVEVTTTTED